jgi:hypothetical protein
MPRPKYTHLEKLDARTHMSHRLRLMLAIIPVVQFIFTLHLTPAILLLVLPLLQSLVEHYTVYLANKRKLTDTWDLADGLIPGNRIRDLAALKACGTDMDFKLWFRFKYDDLERMWREIERDLPADPYLRWPLHGSKKHKYLAFEGWIISLYRYSHLETLATNKKRFGLVDARQSECSSAFLHWFNSTYGHSLTDMKRWAFLSEQSSNAYLSKGFPMPNCHSNTDGKLYRTGRPINRYVEAAVFNFHHLQHGCVYIAIIAACGIHIGFFGPGEKNGRRTRRSST